MRSAFQVVDDIMITEAAGELDHHSAAGLREDIDEAMNAFHCRNLIFNMEKVTFMDSSGIGVILGRYNKVLHKGGTLMIAGCSEYIGKILQMAGVFSIVGCCSTVDEAVSIIRAQEQDELEVVE